MFTGCENLTGELSFPSVSIIDMMSYGNNFGNCYKLTKVSFGHIIQFGISNCYNNSNRGVFNNCTGLKIVDLGDSVENIYESQFEGCSSLKAVIIRTNTVPTVYTNNKSWTRVFCNVSTIVYVPDAALSSYINDTNYFGNNSNNVKPLNEYNEANILAS